MRFSEKPRKIKSLILNLIFLIIFIFSNFGICFASSKNNNSSKAEIKNQDLKEEQEDQISEKINRLSVPFVRNEGQIKNDSVLFYADLFSGRLFINDDSLTYSIMEKRQGSNPNEKWEENEPIRMYEKREIENSKKIAIKEGFVNSEGERISFDPSGQDASDIKISSFISNDKNNWRNNIASYDYLRLGNIWENIRVDLKAKKSNVEKIFTVEPNGNPSDIRIATEGVDEMSIAEDGSLVYQTGEDKVSMTAPIAYQFDINGNKISIPVEYEIIDEKTYSFQVGEYDQNLDLVIDPLLASTFLEDVSSGIHDYFHISIASDGSVYLLAETDSSDFPDPINGFSGDNDMVIAKFDNDLTDLLALTYIGGTDLEGTWCAKLVFDAAGNVFISGATNSSDYPVTAGAFDETYNGGGSSWYASGDFVLSKLSSDLSTLLASTYIGGTGTENQGGLVVDDSGNVYATMPTYSSDFPVSGGAIPTYTVGVKNTGVIKLNNNLTTRLSSTFISGMEGTAILLDASDNIFISGMSEGGLYNVPGSYDETFNGGNQDVAVVKINNDMSQILAATYIGGSGYEDPSIFSSNALAIDTSGNIFVGGETQSTDLPNVGGYDTTYSDYKDSFIAKFNNNLSTLSALTYLGGDGTEEGCEIAIDSDDNVYFLAWTDSTDLSDEYFPTTPGAYQEEEPGSAWGDKNFISKFSSDLSTLVASTYLGSPQDSIGFFSSLAIDSNDNIFAFGIAGDDYPTTSGAYDETMETSGGLFISKLDSDLSGYPMDHLEIRASEDVFEDDMEGSWDPAVWTTTFSADYYGANSIVEAMAVQGDGKTVLGGSFSTYNSVVRSRIARTNTDGSLDTSFDPGTGANSTVYAIAIQADGKILIGGNFTSYNSTSRGGIARLNADGTLDTTFAPTSGINSGSVNSISIQSDGKLIIGGSFTSFNGTARNRVARVNTDGTLDTTFAPTTGANSYVNTTAIQSDGKILIGGYFLTYNGTARRGIARINTDGTLDATFTPGTGFTGGGQEVYTIKLQADEKLLVGGYFTTFNGTSRVGMARLETNGTLDATFSVGTGAFRQVEAIDIQSDENIIIGGYLSSYDGTAINGFARVSSTGVLDGTFVGSKSGIYTLKVLADDSIMIGGYCNTNRGDYTLYGLLKTDSDGTEDDNFNVMPVTPVGWTIDNSDANSGSYSMYSAADATTSELALTTSFDFPTDGQVSFYWKSNSVRYSPLNFCVDIDPSYCEDESSGPGVGYTDRLVGDSGWIYVSVPVTAGNHDFEWYHARNEPTDEAWIDDVKFTSLTDSYAIDTGVAQAIQISAINSEGDRYENYTGDKIITFSGLSSSGINNPKCSDKNGTDVDFGDPATLTFADGVATCNLTAVAAETASVDVTDATYDSMADTGYDLDLIVSAGAPATLSAANSIISAIPSPVEANNSVTITLTAYDSNGDPYISGGDTVVISVSGSNTATPTVTDNGDGTYTATYAPVNAGTDTITATLNGDSVGQDSDGTSDGSFVLAVSNPSPGTEDEEEEESDHLRLTKSKDNKLTFEALISKDKKEKEEIANDDDQGTQLKEIEIKAEKKVDGEFEVKEKKNPKIETSLEELEDHTCSIYSQIEIEADSSIENEDIKNVVLTFRVSEKYKKEHPNANFHATHEKGKKIKILKTQKSNNKSSTDTITVEYSQLEGTWTILDCAENNSNPKENVTPVSVSTPVPEEPIVPAVEPEKIEMDIDNDGNLEQAIDRDSNLSNGFEEFFDPDGSSELEVNVDGDFDQQTDFIINTDGDSNPDMYWDPDSQTISAVEIRNVDEDPLDEYVFGIEERKTNDRYYDKTDKRVRILADSIERPSLLDKARDLANKYHTITTGIVATAAALPLMALPFEVGSLSSAWLVVKESLLRLFGFFFWRRKKFRDWGTVYDVDSGRPIPLAIVKIIDKETGISKETKITDSLGSYYFLVSPGTYALDPEKKEFSEFTNNDLSAFPVWTEKTYQYQPLEFKEYAKVDADIPMKLVDGNFSPLPKKGFWKFMFGIIFWTGLFLNLAIFAITPGVFNALMIFVYLVLEVIRRFGKGKSKWGTVVDENGNIQSFATLKLYDALTQNLVMRTVTDEKGRYFLIANPGEYRLNVETISGKNTQMEFSLDSRSSVKFKIAV